MQHLDQVISALVKSSAHKAVKFVSEKSVIRACRRLVRGRIGRGNLDIVLTVGRPNYSERAFILKLRKAQEPFPVKKIQLKFPPAKRG